MRVCEKPSLITMTQLSVKVGRFAARPGVGDATVFGGIFECDVSDDVSDDRRQEDDVTLPSRTRSSSDLRSYFNISRKFSLPDFQLRGFQCADPDLDPPEVEMMEGDGEGEPGGDPSGAPWLDFYNRTPRAYEDDRILDLLNRVIRLRDSETCDDSPDGRDGAEEVENPGVPPPLPWRRTEEVLLALEDGSKYLREEAEFFPDEEATPQIRINESGDHHHHDQHHPLASFHHQSSSSRSGSFRKIPSFDSVPRPDLSACHSFSLSHWLSEAESRHSEPFCLPHHHLEPSSVSGHRAVPPLPFHCLQNPHQRSCCQGDQHPRSGSESSLSESETSFIPDDGEELDHPGHRDQVLKWLLSNDLEATAVLDKSDDCQSLEETSDRT